MPIVRSNGVQVRVIIWVSLIIVSLALIGMGIGLVFGDPAVILSMLLLIVRFGAVAVAGIIAYVLISAILHWFFK